MTEAIELPHTPADDALHYASPKEGVRSGLYKIRIPKGAKAWRLTTQTGQLPVLCSVYMSIDAPPNPARAIEVGPDYRNVLRRLWSGETLYSYTPENSGTLSVSQSEASPGWDADRERWVYLLFDFGPYYCRSMQGRIDMPAGSTQAPPAIDPALYARAHSLVEKVGLVQSMYRLSGCASNADFEKKAIESGVWPGLIEMVRLAGDGEVR